MQLGQVFSLRLLPGNKLLKRFGELPKAFRRHGKGTPFGREHANFFALTFAARLERVDAPPHIRYTLLIPTLK